METTIIVLIAFSLFVVVKYLFNNGKLSDIQLVTYILGIVGASLIIVEGKNLFGYFGFALLCAGILVKIIDLARRK